MIIAQWSDGSDIYRLVSAEPGPPVLEQLGRDAAGGDRWSKVAYSGSYGSRPTEAEDAPIAGIQDLSSKARAVVDTMNYAKGERRG